MQNAINAAIEALATIRNVEIEIVKQEMREGNEFTMNQVFRLTCAAAAIQ